MDTFDDDRVSDDLAEITGELRARRYDPGALRLDEIKRRALSQASATPDPHGRGLRLRSRTVSLLLVLGLALSGGTAGVMAGIKAANPPAGSKPAKSEYKCNAGNGNGSELPATPGSGSPDCDPGNSAGHNNDNEKEGPPGTKPPPPRK
jgi:hypothetical protein